MTLARQADLVAVLDEGRLVEVGAPADAALARARSFRDLWTHPVAPRRRRGRRHATSAFARPTALDGSDMTGSPGRAVVTGAAGFIGSHLCERLIADGWRVVGVDGFTDYYPRAEKEENLAGLLRHQAFALVEADVVGESWRSVLSPGDTVFHLAAQPGVRGSFGASFARYARDNVVATQRVFEAALAAGSPAGRVGLVVVGVRRRAGLPVLGAVATRPRSPYGVTKRACEDLAGVYRDQGLADRRPPLLHGVRAPPAARHGDAPDVRGGRRRRAVPDLRRRLPVARLHVRGRRLRRHACGRPRPTTRPPSTTSAAARRRAWPASSRSSSGWPARRLELTRVARRRGDVRRTAADTTAARRDLGWRPVVDLEDGTAPGAGVGSGDHVGEARGVTVRLAVVTSGFPRISETFALNELLALRRRGHARRRLRHQARRLDATATTGGARCATSSRVLPAGDVDRQAGAVVDGLAGVAGHRRARLLRPPAGGGGGGRCGRASACRTGSAPTPSTSARSTGTSWPGGPTARAAWSRATARPPRALASAGVRRPARARTASTSPASRPAPRAAPAARCACWRVGRLVEKKGFDVAIARRRPARRRRRAAHRRRRRRRGAAARAR